MYNIAKDEYYNKQKPNQKESELIKKNTRVQEKKITTYEHELKELTIKISDN